MYKEIRLKRGKEESLRRFHPWVFSGAILKIDEGVNEGDVVRVLANSGDFIAVGHYQEGSIAVRVLSFSDVRIDDEFWHSRLSSALKMRQAIGIADNPDNNTYRLVHGEGDLLTIFLGKLLKVGTSLQSCCDAIGCLTDILKCSTSHLDLTILDRIRSLSLCNQFHHIQGIVGSGLERTASLSY